MSRRTLVIGSAAAAIAVAGALVAALALGSGGSTRPPVTFAGAAQVETMLRGIPQSGTTLGSETAPVTLVEFADPQCPYCADWELQSLPAIVERYVRTGKVRIVFNGLAFVGPDSATALQTAVAAGEQNRLWNVIALLYRNQGTENTGWVSDSLLRSVGEAVSGLDTKRMLAERSSDAVSRAIAQAKSFASQAGVNATPTFAVGKTGGVLRLVQLTSLEPSGLIPSLDAALRG